MVLGTFATKSTEGNIEYKEIEIEYNALMFTLDQIREAHAKVKSGADFPGYIENLIILGIQKYNIFVHDGHGEYFGEDGSMLISSPKYDTLTIADTSNKEVFTKQLRAHQQGQTDYMTFCQESANAGIEKSTVDTITLTCTYYDKKGKLILTENIPNKTQEMLVRFFSLLFIGYGIWGITEADFYVF